MVVIVVLSVYVYPKCVKKRWSIVFIIVVLRTIWLGIWLIWSLSLSLSLSLCLCLSLSLSLSLYIYIYIHKFRYICSIQISWVISSRYNNKLSAVDGYVENRQIHTDGLTDGHTDNTSNIYTKVYPYDMITSFKLKRLLFSVVTDVLSVCSLLITQAGLLQMK